MDIYKIPFSRDIISEGRYFCTMCKNFDVPDARATFIKDFGTNCNSLQPRRKSGSSCISYISATMVELRHENRPIWKDRTAIKLWIMNCRSVDIYLELCVLLIWEVRKLALMLPFHRPMVSRHGLSVFGCGRRSVSSEEQSPA